MHRQQEKAKRENTERKKRKDCTMRTHHDKTENKGRFWSRRGLVVLLAGLAGTATLALGAGRAAAQTGPDYNISINTTDINAQDDYFQLAFDPANLTGFLNAAATITNFQFDGSLTGASILTGDVTGALPGPLTITNDDPGGVNSLLQEATFGNTLSFDVAFSGAAFDPTQISTAASDFSVQFFDPNGAPLLVDTTDPNNPGGVVADINIAPNVVVTPTTYPEASGVASVATITPLAPSGGGGSPTVPEPSSGLLVAAGLGLALIAGACGRRRWQPMGGTESF
jgi:hypothetical protein